MTVCVSCRLYLLRDEFENLISRETEGRAGDKFFQRIASCFMIFTTLCKNKIWKVVRSCDTSSYHIWNRISLCVDTDFFPVVLYFTRVRRLYLSQKNHWYIITLFISFFPVGYHEIAVKIFFDLTLVPILMFLLSRLIARAS